MGRIISIADTKNNYAKTVVSVNLALALAAQTKEEVVCIDLALTGVNTFELLTGVVPDKAVNELEPLLTHCDVRLIRGYLTPAHNGVILIDGISPGEPGTMSPAGLYNIVRLISDAYPYTLIAIPEAYGNYWSAVMELSDALLLNICSQLLSLNEARVFTGHLKSVPFPLERVRLLIHRTGAKAVDRNTIEDFLGARAVAELPDETELLAASINNSVPAILSAPHSAFAAQMRELAAAVFSGALFGGTAPRKREPKDTGGATPAASSPAQEFRRRLKEKIHREVLASPGARNLELGNLSDPHRRQQARDTMRKLIHDIFAAQTVEMPAEEGLQLVNELLDEILGLGCIETLLDDPGITEIMVNGTAAIYIERHGRIHPADTSFASPRQLMTAIDRIVSPLGRRVDEASPVVDARLPDGSRVNVIIPPVALNGPVVTIRKFAKKKLTAGELVALGTLTEPMGEFLKACVRLRKNIAISGGTGSGKTTLLNVISSFIPGDERIITIEDAAELQLPQAHVVRLEARPPSIEGSGEITIRRLVINALRMRPDRIVVGECRGGEALDMLQAMNTGHDGSLTTVHANSPRDALLRVTTMTIMAGSGLSERAIRDQIGSALHIIVQLSRLRDGSRKVTEIAELRADEGELRTTPLFVFKQSGMSEGRVTGGFVATGETPAFLTEAASKGVVFSPALFKP